MVDLFKVIYNVYFSYFKKMIEQWAIIEYQEI